MARSRAIRRRLRVWLSRSMVPLPFAYVVAAVALGVLAPAIDRTVGTPLQRGVGLDAAHDVLTSMGTGMIAFTGLVVSSVLLVVQFAAGQYSPRLVAWFGRDPLVKHAIGSFLAAPLFALVALREIERKPVKYSPDITVVIALLLFIAAAVMFLVLLQRVLDGLRPRAIYRGVARAGVRAIHATYPLKLGEAGRAGIGVAEEWREQPSRELRNERRSGVLTSFDAELLLLAAIETGTTIEVLPGVGEFIARGRPLLRVYGDAQIDGDALLGATTIEEERTIGQDPAYAIRVIVDTAIRALSPAVNDPTTAVHGLDALEVLTRDLASRDLESSLAADDRGITRLVWRVPGWDELLGLALDEIRGYGADSVQVCRRLRALLEDLREATPSSRHAAIDTHLARLGATVREAHPEGSPDLQIANVADRLGLGLGRGG